MQYVGICLDRPFHSKAQYLSIFDRGVDRLFLSKAQYLSIFDRGVDRLFSKKLGISVSAMTVFLKYFSKKAQYLSIFPDKSSVSQYLSIFVY